MLLDIHIHIKLKQINIKVILLYKITKLNNKNLMKYLKSNKNNYKLEIFKIKIIIKKIINFFKIDKKVLKFKI